MRLHSFSVPQQQPHTLPATCSNRDGFVQPASAFALRSGTTQPTPDSFETQPLNETLQQATTFLANATTQSPHTLEAQFLASVLDKHLAVGKNVDGSVKTMEQAVEARSASRLKLLTYLENNELQGVFTLLNGTHAPVENEFTGKYNPFKWVQNKMQGYVQEQPQHANLPPELHSFEAFEHHVKTLQHQFQRCLGEGGDPSKAIALAPKTPEALASATQQVTEQLAVVRSKISALETLAPEGLVHEAIAHNLQTSADSVKMVKLAWFQNLLRSVDPALLETPVVQRYLQGLLLAVGGDSATEGQAILKYAIARLVPQATPSASFLAPLPQKMLDNAITLKGNFQGLAQYSQGLPVNLLAQLPPAFQSAEALQSGFTTFQNNLNTVDASVINFAKTLIVSSAEQADLVQAYRLAMAQQAIQLEQQLGALANPIDKMDRFAQQKAFIAEIPNDVRMTAQEFLANERRRLAEMLRLEATVQTPLVAQIEQTVGTVRDEVFNPTETKRQLSEFQAELNQAVHAEIVAPLVERVEAINRVPALIQTQAQTWQAEVLATLNTRILDPLKAKATQIATTLSESAETGATALNPHPPEANPKVGEAIASNVAKGVPKLTLPTSANVKFAKPLVVAEKQGEKLGWFPALLDQNKEWLPLAVVGTIGLGLLTTIGVLTAKSKKQSSGDGGAAL